MVRAVPLLTWQPRAGEKGLRRPVHEVGRHTPLKCWQLSLDVDLTGVFLVTREAIPYIRARGGGH